MLWSIAASRRTARPLTWRAPRTAYRPRSVPAFSPGRAVGRGGRPGRGSGRCWGARIGHYRGWCWAHAGAFGQNAPIAVSRASASTARHNRPRLALALLDRPDHHRTHTTDGPTCSCSLTTDPRPRPTTERSRSTGHPSTAGEHPCPPTGHPPSKIIIRRQRSSYSRHEKSMLATNDSTWARCTTRCAAVRELANNSRTSRCPSDSPTATAAQLMSHKIMHCKFNCKLLN
jgi:hypothetical protein